MADFIPKLTIDNFSRLVFSHFRQNKFSKIGRAVIVYLIIRKYFQDFLPVGNNFTFTAELIYYYKKIAQRCLNLKREIWGNIS